MKSIPIPRAAPTTGRTAEGGGDTSTYPFEDWRYRYIEGIGNDIIIEFVDPTHDRRVPHDDGPVGKRRSALCSRRRPDARRIRWALADKAQRFNNTDGTHLASGHGRMQPASYQRIRALEQFAKLQMPPPVKFKDLEAAITTRITYNVLPMLVRVDYVRITESSVIANITVQFDNKDLQFQLKDGVEKSVVNLLGRDHQHDAPADHDFRKAARDRRSAGHAAEIRRAEVDLPGIGAAGARPLPAEHRGQGHYRGQYE